MAPTFQAAAGGGVSGPGSSTTRDIATWNGTTGSALYDNPGVTISSGGILQNTKQPAFLVYLGSSTGNITGDGTQATVPFNTIVFDQASNFNTSTYTFTAPVTGKYLFSANVLTLAGSALNTAAQTLIVTTAHTYNFGYISPAASYIGAGGGWSIPGTIIVPMSANDTATIAVTVTGNASKNVAVDGVQEYTWFSGYLVC
jgi:hypothetical protein